MTARSTYQSGEEVRGIHVLGALEPGVSLPVMGPKAGVGEYVEGELETLPPVPGVDLLVPATYDEPVLDVPGVDFNWEITTYRSSNPGPHDLVWGPGELHSNVLTIKILDVG